MSGQNHEIRGRVRREHRVEVPMPSLEEKIKRENRMQRREHRREIIGNAKDRFSWVTEVVGRATHKLIDTVVVYSDEPTYSSAENRKTGRRVLAGIALSSMLVGGLTIVSDSGKEDCAQFIVSDFGNDATPAEAATTLTRAQEALSPDAVDSSLYNRNLAGFDESGLVEVCGPTTDQLVSNVLD